MPMNDGSYMKKKAKRAIGDYDYNESTPEKRDEYVTPEEEDEEDEEGSSDTQGNNKEPPSDKAGRIAWAIAQGMATYGKQMKEYHAKRESWRRRFSK